MYDLGKHLMFNKEQFNSNPKHVFKGEKYRISILSECLVRIEYDPNGQFNNFLTPLVRNRLFSEPTYIKKEDNVLLNIETKYFTLNYVKEAHFTNKSLTVKLNGTNLVWCYGMKEYKNFKSTASSLDNMVNLPNLEKGLFSPDGFVTLDDSNSLLIDEYSNVYKNTFSNKHIDLYLFMYNKDFGKCLKDYFNLTGYPAFIPRYALGNWWSREYKYNEKSLIETLDKFNYSNIPLSVLLLDKDWSKN